MGYGSSETNVLFFLTALEQALREQHFEVPHGAAVLAGGQGTISRTSSLI